MLRWTTAVLLSAAALAVGGQLRISIVGSPVPVTGQTLALALVAALGGARIAVPAVLLFIGAAAVGAPILSGGRGGISVITGPSVGYLTGFVAAAAVIPALLQKWGRRRWLLVWLAIEAGSACVLGLGVLGLIGRGTPADVAVARGLLPFLPGDVIKSSIAATIVWLRGRRDPSP